MIKRLIWTIWTPMSSVLKKADKLNLSLSLGAEAGIFLVNWVNATASDALVTCVTRASMVLTRIIWSLSSVRTSVIIAFWMYRLWLHSLYGLHGPQFPLSPKRLLNLITHSLTQCGEMTGHANMNHVMFPQNNLAQQRSTHWGQEKMAIILQMAFSNSFYCMKMYPNLNFTDINSQGSNYQ